MARKITTMAFSTPFELKNKIKEDASKVGMSASRYITLVMMKHFGISTSTKGVDNLEKIE